MQRAGIDLMTMIRCFTGPELYKRYKTAEEPARIYKPNFFESKADAVLWAASAVKTFCIYISPILLTYFYRRGYINWDNSVRFGTWILILYGSAYLVRGIGRLFNPDYLTFLTVLEAA